MDLDNLHCAINIDLAEFTAEVESEFAEDQPSVDPMQEFEDECLRSFGYTVNFLALDDFDDNRTLVKDVAGDADDGSVINRRPHSANAYPFEFGEVCKSNWYLKFVSELTIFHQGTTSEILDHCFE